MNKIRSIDDILVRLEEIRNSLKFGEEVFPLLSDLFTFLKDIIPLMLEANITMREGTDRLPDATNYILKVSQTTEDATHKVMDNLECIINHLGELSDEIKSESNNEEQLNRLDEAMGKASDIIYALQFQDITTQQLEHTNRILSAVYEKFSALIKSFSKLKSTTLFGGDVVTAIENEFSRTLNKHQEFFDQRTEDLIRNDGVSQDDIDNLFDG